MTARVDVEGTRRLSVEEFAALPEEDGHRLELSRGLLVREPAPGPLHGQVAARLFGALWNFVEDRGLGLVFFDTAFTLSTRESIVRVPDLAFVRAERIPEEGLTDRFWKLAPDLVVEVVSPSNRTSQMQQKVVDYLHAGAQLVWVVDPAERTVTVYRSRSQIRILEGDEVLQGEEVLPDLRLPLAEIFAL